MSVLDHQALCQFLSLLPLQDFAAPILDYRKHELTSANLLKIFMAAQLMEWGSLGTIAEEIRAHEGLQKEFGVSSISKSTLSRRIESFPVDITWALFQAVVDKISSHARLKVNLPPSVGKIGKKLALVDSTNIQLPFFLAYWANVTQHRSGVKVHTRLMVVDSQMQYPDKIVPSTGNVTDYEGSDWLVTDPDTLYIMDRGYVSYARMDSWLEAGIDFVIRIHNHHYAEIIEEHGEPGSEGSILRDATVLLGNNAATEMKGRVRLIEFQDEKGTLFRLATSRWDLSAPSIMELYRMRWLIELFFKWMKQHLKFAKLYSYQPNAVWNHIFLALTAYGLTFLHKLELETGKTLYGLLQLFRTYAGQTWERFIEALNRQPSRASAGRQKREGPREVAPVEETAGVYTKKKKKKKGK